MRFPFLTKTGWSCITWLWGEWEEGGMGGVKNTGEVLRLLRIKIFWVYWTLQLLFSQLRTAIL